jgi:plasmid stabilization system protein ParE
MQIKISHRAKRDLARILAYLQPRSPMAASRLSDALESAILGLGEFPRMGRARTEFGADLKSLVAENYVIIYRIDTLAIVILRVLDGRMDIETELSR